MPEEAGRLDAMADCDAIVLAGGRAVRMSGADKPGLEVGGTAMLISVARAAVAAGCRQLIVVGPHRSGSVAAGLAELAARLPGGLMAVREDPPGGGPLPALRRALPEVTAPSLLLLAADLPFLTGAELTSLRELAAGGDAAGAVLADETGRPQWLVSWWQTAKVRAAVAGYPGTSLRGLLAPLRPAEMQVQVADGRPGPWLDCDTPGDLAAARARRLSTSAEGS